MHLIGFTKANFSVVYMRPRPPYLTYKESTYQAVNKLLSVPEPEGIVALFAEQTPVDAVMPAAHPSELIISIPDCPWPSSVVASSFIPKLSPL